MRTVETAEASSGHKDTIAVAKTGDIYMIDVTVVRRVRPRAIGSCDCEGRHR